MFAIPFRPFVDAYLTNVPPTPLFRVCCFPQVPVLGVSLSCGVRLHAVPSGVPVCTAVNSAVMRPFSKSSEGRSRRSGRRRLPFVSGISWV